MNFKAQASTKFSGVAALEEKIVPRLVKAMRNATGAVLDEAQVLVPVDTGELQSSGRTAVEILSKSVVGSISFTAPHAMFVEYGTGIKGRGTYPYDLPQTGVPITGAWIYDYKQQMWIGHAAQPYLRPALDGSKPNIFLAFEQEGFNL